MPAFDSPVALEARSNSDTSMGAAFTKAKDQFEDYTREKIRKSLGNPPEFVVKPGMAESIFNDKYARVKSLQPNPAYNPDLPTSKANPKVIPEYETFQERIETVILGNLDLLTGNRKAQQNGLLAKAYRQKETNEMLELGRMGAIPFSGRHLQHGDLNQRKKWIEKFSNCSTSPFSFAKFMLLLEGSGVGRSYSSIHCRVNWDNMPEIRVCLAGNDYMNPENNHPDFNPSWMESLRDARHKYPSESENVRWFKVKDSREGWAEVIACIETAAFDKKKDMIFIFDFSDVRPKGSPIKGLQNKPADGPEALMKAVVQIASLKGLGWAPWKQAFFIDDYLAKVVQLGGQRRSSRIGFKHWKDNDILEFIELKRGGFLTSANNSVMVDEEFWSQVGDPRTHASRVFMAVNAAAYYDGTGEPGFINVDMIKRNDTGLENLTAETYLNPLRMSLHKRTFVMADRILDAIKKSPYYMGINPCAEIALNIAGGLCIVGDVNLNVCDKNAARLAVKHMARALIRTNLMDALYKTEVNRTNRIGVSLIGIYEFAWKIFGATIKDLITDTPHGAKFWAFIDELREIVESQASTYSLQIGLPECHTALCLKPGGTISKVMSTTESANPPANPVIVRWVQYPKGSSEAYRLMDQGYPYKDISSQYNGMCVIGFPHAMGIVELMGDKCVTIDDLNLDEQFELLRRLEKHWLGTKMDNQISITLKYEKDKLSFQEYCDIMQRNMSTIKCAAIMPQFKITDKSAYIYLPEEVITYDEYRALKDKITIGHEAVDQDNLQCESGVCPIEENRDNFVTQDGKVLDGTTGETIS